MKKTIQNLFKKNNSPVNGPKIVRSEDTKEATIFIYDVIDSWYGISAEEMAKEIMALDVETIHVRINSPGGNVFDARAIKTVLDQHAAKVIAHIDGVAASSASWLPINFDEIRISSGAMMMIHESWGFSIGNAREHRENASLLEKIDGIMVMDYVKKTGKKESEVKDLMEAETWFDAEEALAAGLVDSIFQPESKDKNASISNWDLSAFENAPNPKENNVEVVNHNRAKFEARLGLYERTG